MSSSTANQTRLRPNIHFLDLIAKVHSKQGRTFNLAVQETGSHIIAEYNHSYPASELVFNNKIVYNKDFQIVNWTVIGAGKEFIIFDENE